jgi:hypothetical protein
MMELQNSARKELEADFVCFNDALNGSDFFFSWTHWTHFLPSFFPALGNTWSGNSIGSILIDTAMLSSNVKTQNAGSSDVLSLVIQLVRASSGPFP